MTLKNIAPREAHKIATIYAGASLSEAIATSTQPRGIAVRTPAVWTAADIGFQVSNDGVTYYKVFDDGGSRVKITGIATGAAGVYNTPPEAWIIGSWYYLKLESIDTSTEAGVVQAATRDLSIVLLA